MGVGAAVRLLIVEDDARMAALLKRAEEDGYAVDISADGRKHCGWVAERYDAIMLDAMLPGLDGSRSCGVARESAVGARVMVPGLEAGTDEAWMRGGRLSGRRSASTS
jgi:DNA-binding response OmpR family regulator